MPVLKQVLIDERDTFLAEKIKESEGEKIVAVVGAGHMSGILNHLSSDDDRPDLEEIQKIPKSSSVIKYIGWGIPLIIFLSILYIGLTKGIDEAGDNILFWILANGIPCGIGTLISLAHPITIIVAFTAAPFTSLTPVIGAGYVAAFVQAYIQPPIVKEFESVSDDINKIAKWWSNRLLKIFLVFILAGLGSALGTYVGAYEIIKNVFS
jgi:pheromone shutdown-related protein TraB